MRDYIATGNQKRQQKTVRMESKKSKIFVLFVCMGNICRSPTAEGVFRHLVINEAPDLEIEIDSAGTHAYHAGSPPDKRAQQAARQRGISLSSIRARVVEPDDFYRFDYVLAMDESNFDDLALLCPPDKKDCLRLFLEFSSSPEIRNVPDPYYGGDAGFEKVLDLVEDAARGLLETLVRSQPPR